MKKNIVVISSSLRINSNSEILAKEFVKGAEKNNNVELINLKDYEINFCKGCLACQSTGKCIIDDGVKDIIEKVENADVVVFSTPIYYYSIAGQLKTLLDRLNPLYIANYKFREVYLITACADEDANAINGSKVAIEGWVECFPKSKLVKTFCGGGCNLGKEVLQHQDLLDKVRKIGENV